MNIRKALAADAQAIFDLRNRSIRCLCKGFYPDDLLLRWTEGVVPSRRFVEFVSQLIYVAESSDRIVGCGAVSLIDGKIDAVFVDPDHAGNGIGRKVMQFLEEVAIESGSTATLHLEASLNAMPFYTKLGFAVDSPSLYISPRGFSLECIKMSKTLDDH